MSNETGEFETSGNDEIVCPYCGWRDVDSWEAPDSYEVDCPDCDKPFKAYRHVKVTYSSVGEKARV